VRQGSESDSDTWLNVSTDKESANCRLEAQYGHQQNVQTIPLMMEVGYKPTGWLGIIMGSRLYFNFHPAAVETDELFMQKVDLVQRELGDRGRVSEGVPPPARVGHAWEPEPEPEAAPSRALAPATPAAASSLFSPSMQQLSSPMPNNQQPWSSENTSLVEVLITREDKIRQEAKAERAEMRAEMEASMEAKLQQLREEMEASMEAVSPQQIAALQARLEALYDAELLSEEIVFSIEDTIADFVELTSLMGVVTVETGHSNAVVGKLIKLVALSSNIAADGAFARQVRRKHA
jgi:hypothetical protein